MNLSSASTSFIAVFANATISAGTETFRAVYDAPTKQGAIYGEGLSMADPQIVALTADLEAVETRNGTPLTVTRDNYPTLPIDYLAKQVSPDGMGLSVCTLKRQQ